MPLTTIALIGLALWLVTGTLMLATRDPLGFAQFFWGLVTIVAWPIALGAHKILERRRARATVIETPTTSGARATGRRHGVDVVIAAVRDAAPRTDDLLIGQVRDDISARIEQAAADAEDSFRARLAATAEDPVAALDLRTERQAFVSTFNASRAIANGTLDQARELDAEGERAAIPLVGDLLRRLDALREGTTKATA